MTKNYLYRKIEEFIFKYKATLSIQTVTAFWDLYKFITDDEKTK